jgi:hypothetical protein
MNSLLYYPNYFWDYSTLISLNQNRYDYESALSTIYAFYFFGTNKYGLKVSDTIGFGTFTFTDVYNFYRKQSSEFATEGIGFKYGGVPLAAYYTNDDEIYQFPLNYLDRDSSRFAFSVSLGTGISYSQVGYRINEVDGWGSIKTPYDSVACLRVVSTVISSDSINFNGFGFSFPNNQRSVKWLSTTEKIPMLEVSGTYYNNTFNANLARYRDNYIAPLIGIAKNTVEQAFTVFPNPTAETITIKNPNNLIFSYSITDSNGKMVNKTELKAEEESFSVANLNNGIYYLNLLDKFGKNLGTRKIVVAK